MTAIAFIGVGAPIIPLVRDRWAEARDALGPTTDNSKAIDAWRPQMESRDG